MQDLTGEQRTTRLADRLKAARKRHFVGRETECDLFRQALAQAANAPQVFHVYGLGGIGKTTLLREFAALCDSTEVKAIQLKGHEIEPSREAFSRALETELARALDLPISDQIISQLSEQPFRVALLIDTYEQLLPLDSWLRETLLPSLPENVLIVLAGRESPDWGWKSDAGWQSLLCYLPLRNLSPEESRQFLATKQIDVTQHEALLDFTHGHPLALSLVADLFAQQPGFYFEPEAAADTIKVLIDHLIREVPSSAHRLALEACSLVRCMNEDLLAAIMGQPLGAGAEAADVHQIFGWLRGLSFIESNSAGLCPHDLAREVLAADLVWRDPEAEAALRQRAHTFYENRLRTSSALEQQNVLFDYMFLHRHISVVRPFMEWSEGARLALGVARPSEIPVLATTIAGHEGQESAELFSAIYQAQPQSVQVLRDGEKIEGLLVTLTLRPDSGPELLRDPVATRAWNHLQTQGGLRSGECASIFRWWMAGATYQAVSPAQSQIFANIVRHCLTTPGLAYSFLCCSNPSFWEPIAAYTNMTRFETLDFAVGGHRYGVYGNDWRALPPLQWLALLAEREKANALVAPPPVQAPEAQLITLSETEFASAVQQAFRNLTNARGLRANPLLQSRLVVERAGTEATLSVRLTTLQTLFQEVCDALKNSPRRAKSYQALYHAYLHPAPTQEAAAQRLDLPFSTFRRHLKSGLDEVTVALWQREIGQ